MKKNFLLTLLVALMAVSFTSCDDNEDFKDVVLTLNATQIEYDQDGVWKDCFTKEATTWQSQNIIFSHAAPFPGYWTGMIPSRSRKEFDQDATDYMPYQYTAMTKGGLSGLGTPYVVGYWSEYDFTTTGVQTCEVSFGQDAVKKPFTPLSMYVTNTMFSYYTMLKGNAFSPAFKSGDFLDLIVVGFKGESKTETGRVSVRLADYTGAEPVILDNWKQVELESLGEVDGIYFYFDTTAKNEYGITAPTYFALDRLVVRY